MERQGAEFPILIGQTGPLNGQRWAIRGTMTLGRDAACDIVIPDRQVSRYHARLVYNPGGVLLEDLASKNGTYCNGTRVVEPVTMQDGDMIQIALIQHFVFLSSDATVPLSGDIPLPVEREHRRLVMDLQSRRVWILGREVLPPLSMPQFRLLQVLYEHAGNVVPRDQLVREVWGSEEAIGVSEQALDALIRRVRERLAMLDPKHNYLTTVRGHGLRLDNPPV